MRKEMNLPQRSQLLYKYFVATKMIAQSKLHTMCGVRL